MPATFRHRPIDVALPADGVFVFESHHVPGFRMAVHQSNHTAHLVVMPGVPREMKPMMEQQVIPWIRSNRGSEKIFATRIFQTFGISESGLDEQVAGLIRPEEAKVGFRASFPQISLKVMVEDFPGLGIVLSHTGTEELLHTRQVSSMRAQQRPLDLRGLSLLPLKALACLEMLLGLSEQLQTPSRARGQEMYCEAAGPVP